MKDNATDVRRLQAAITRITNRVCVSTDADYLRRRLADLKARDAAGENVRHGASSQEAHAILTASMPESARLAAVEMGNRLKIGTSATVRHALHKLAVAMEWNDLAAKFDENTNTSKGKNQ